MIILGGVLTGIAAKLGIDPIHFGTIVVTNFAIGMATPPFGYSLFVGSAISGVSIETIARALWPMLCVQIFVLLLVTRSEEHTSELQSLMRISYAVFCLKKKKELILTSRSNR